MAPLIGAKLGCSTHWSVHRAAEATDLSLLWSFHLTNLEIHGRVDLRNVIPITDSPPHPLKMPPQKRMTANPVKPARYRAGKAAGPESSSESEGSGSEQEDETAKKAPPRRAAPPKFANAAGPGRIISRGDGAKINLQGVGAGDRADEEARRQAATAARLAAEKQAKEEGFVTEEEDESEEEGSEEESEEEEESSSEEEAPRRLMMRPKFIPKNQRQGNGAATIATTAAAATTAGEKEEQDEEAAAEARRAAADELIEEQIKKDLAARSAGRKHWEDDADVSDAGAEVDDTDDLDPEAEYAAWKLRELKRLRRERDAIEAKEAELAEIERRRNLTEEERRAEDDAHVAQQREEKEGRGKMAFMQKYFHKGAFYQDESKAAGLDKRDIVGARFVDDVNRELLPKALQMRDMTKVGKKGATRYRDLKSEDTGQWGRLDDGRPRREFDRNVDERFQPDDDRRRDWDRGDAGAKGANAIPLGNRRETPKDNDRETQRGPDRDQERYRDRRDSDRRLDDSRDRRRSRSRSRSPRQERGDRRKRSPSRERDRDRYESDKRRRVDAR